VVEVEQSAVGGQEAGDQNSPSGFQVHPRRYR
jgi:hypothetical protein